MPAKFKPDDLVEAFTDAKVMAALVAAIGPMITERVEAAIDRRMNELLATTRELKNNYTTLQKKLVDLECDNKTLRQQLVEQSGRIDDLDIVQRCDNLIFKGLPERSYAERSTVSHSLGDSQPVASSSQAIESTIIKFCKDSLNIDVSLQDISSAYRMRAGAKDTARPVMVRFSSHRIRDEIYRTKKLLKDRPERIYISEHLTKSVADLYYEARKLQREKKIHSTWTQNCRVMVKRTSDPNDKPSMIKCLADLTAPRA